MIDDALIDSDERGFTLTLVGDFGEAIDAYDNDLGSRLTFRLPQDAALKLLAAVRSVIGPWAAEMEDARREWSTAWPMFDGEAGGLGLDDPKHPGYHDALAERSDTIRKRAKGE